MARIGSALLLVAQVALAAEPDFYMSVDRNEVGTEDPFVLTVVLANAPEGGQLKLPLSDDFERLSGTSTSNQMKFQMGAGGGEISRVQKTQITLRANKAGALVLPGAEYVMGNGKTLKTEPLKITAKQGQLAKPTRPRPADPFAGLDPFGGRDPFEDFPDPFEPQVRIPSRDSDLFVRAEVDKAEIYVGEQLTYSLAIYSRLPVVGIDSPVLPKFEGFLSEDVDSPGQIIPKSALVDQVPYQVYLVRRRALFPQREGEVVIGGAELPISVGGFFSDKIVRKSNPLKLKVKPLPPGARADFVPENIGRWRLSAQASATRTGLGQPITIKVILEGVGNVKLVNPLAMRAPSGVKLYDPEISTKTEARDTELRGRKTFEYLVMPEMTGSFTFPAMGLSYFDPRKGTYERTETAPFTLEVEAGQNGQTRIPTNPNDAAQAAADPSRNVLNAGALRTLRLEPKFEEKTSPLYRRPFFIPSALGPVGVFFGAVVVSLLLRRGPADEAELRKRRGKEAHQRLARARKLEGASAADFYGELQRAVLDFLEFKLGVKTSGMSLATLEGVLAEKGVPEGKRVEVRSALELAEAGRYAPEGVGPSRSQALDVVERALSGWETR